MLSQGPLSPGLSKIDPYSSGVPRKLRRPRPAQGARLRDLRLAAGLSQQALADAVGVPQANIAFWERSHKPPRSDVLPMLANALAVHVDVLLGLADPDDKPSRRSRPGPPSKLELLLRDALKLPRRQQLKVIEVVDALVRDFSRKAG